MQTNSQPIQVFLTEVHNDSQDFFLELINSKLFFAFCTTGYRGYQEYESQADLIINYSGIYFFFQFQDSFAKKLEVTTL